MFVSKLERTALELQKKSGDEEKSGLSYITFSSFSFFFFFFLPICNIDMVPKTSWFYLFWCVQRKSSGYLSDFLSGNPLSHMFVNRSLGTPRKQLTILSYCRNSLRCEPKQALEFSAERFRLTSFFSSCLTKIEDADFFFPCLRLNSSLPPPPTCYFESTATKMHC